MEKLNFPQKAYKTWFLRFVMATAAVTTLAACPGKNSGGGGDIPVVQNCIGCAGIGSPTVLVNQANSRGYDLQMSWQLLGDSQAMATMLPATNPYGNYVGLAIARGGITITNPIGNVYGGGYGYGYGNNNYGNGASCTIPVGSYSFDTVSPGQLQQGSFNLPAMQASGPVTFTFSATGVIYKPGGYGQEAIYATINITSINGVNCGGIGTSIY